jgi:hypothetical protein
MKFVPIGTIRILDQLPNADVCRWMTREQMEEYQRKTAEQAKDCPFCKAGVPTRKP